MISVYAIDIDLCTWNREKLTLTISASEVSNHKVCEIISDNTRIVIQVNGRTRMLHFSYKDSVCDGHTNGYLYLPSDSMGEYLESHELGHLAGISLFLT